MLRYWMVKLPDIWLNSTVIKSRQGVSDLPGIPSALCFFVFFFVFLFFFRLPQLLVTKQFQTIPVKSWILLPTKIHLFRRIGFNIRWISSIILIMANRKETFQKCYRAFQMLKWVHIIRTTTTTTTKMHKEIWFVRVYMTLSINSMQ